jgi:hypothetical protein
MLTATQRETIEAVVSIFENGHLPGPAAYATAAILADGAGLSYGIHQATAHSGSLIEVLREYERRGGMLLASDYQTVRESTHYDCERMDADAIARGCSKPASPAVLDLLQRLRRWGTAPAMQEAQRSAFDRLYWQPAELYARNLGLRMALSYLVVYDTSIHSGRSRIDKLRATFPELPPSRGGLEASWTVALLNARHRWLGTSGSALVRSTRYRTAALLELAQQGRWELERPLTVRGVTIK